MGRSATPALLSAGALCLAFVLSSCGTPEAGSDAAAPDSQEAQPASDTGSPDPTSSAEPSVKPSASPSVEPPEPALDGDWTTYTTTDGSLSFDHPADWTVAAVPEAPPEGVAVVVGDAGGRQ
ncbi:hypothetical protein CVO76_09960, partial [Arthrobacter agilis]